MIRETRACARKRDQREFLRRKDFTTSHVERTGSEVEFSASEVVAAGCASKSGAAPYDCGGRLLRASTMQACTSKPRSAA